MDNPFVFMVFFLMVVCIFTLMISPILGLGREAIRLVAEATVAFILAWLLLCLFLLVGVAGTVNL